LIKNYLTVPVYLPEKNFSDEITVSLASYEPSDNQIENDSERVKYNLCIKNT